MASMEGDWYTKAVNAAWEIEYEAARAEQVTTTPPTSTKQAKSHPKPIQPKPCGAEPTYHIALEGRPGPKHSQEEMVIKRKEVVELRGANPTMTHQKIAGEIHLTCQGSTDISQIRLASKEGIAYRNTTMVIPH